MNAPALAAPVQPRDGWRTCWLYLAGALVATLVNIAVQESARRLMPGNALALPMLAGTASGFAAKYLFDKHLVFADARRGAASEVRKLGLYGLFSVGTTLVFWSTELLFWSLWHTAQARYIGAALGLAIGYAAKYRLDRTFVFRDRAA